MCQIDIAIIDQNRLQLGQLNQKWAKFGFKLAIIGQKWANFLRITINNQKKSIEQSILLHRRDCDVQLLLTFDCKIFVFSGYKLFETKCASEGP